MSQELPPRQLPPRMRNPSAAAEFAAITARALAMTAALTPSYQNQDSGQIPRLANQAVMTNVVPSNTFFNPGGPHISSFARNGTAVRLGVRATEFQSYNADRLHAGRADVADRAGQHQNVPPKPIQASHFQGPSGREDKTRGKDDAECKAMVTGVSALSNKVAQWEQELHEFYGDGRAHAERTRTVPPPHLPGPRW